MIKTWSIILLSVICVNVFAQEQDTLYFSKLEISDKKKHIFRKGDSSQVIRIDTLIMANRSELHFFGKKNIELNIGIARIGTEARIFGTDGKNNGTNFTINTRFEQLGSLYVLAGGLDASNGFRTHPNGNGGNVSIIYDPTGIVLQPNEKQKKHYLLIDTRAGGYRTNPGSDLRNIYSRIHSYPGGPALLGLPQGMIYSGSPGIDGTISINKLQD